LEKVPHSKHSDQKCIIKESSYFLRCGVWNSRVIWGLWFLLKGIPQDFLINSNSLGYLLHISESERWMGKGQL
jgi:hypothetical protein